MHQHDHLIAFLEHEARFLRHRIADYKQVEFPTGITSGEVDPPRTAGLKADAESKLREIEAQIRELRFLGQTA
jgi:hypothetical protein